METYLISDTHFNHANIIDYCNRPFGSVDAMNKSIIQNWNNKVKKEDRVFFLGDFCMGGAQQIKYFASQLNGRKSIVLGNHDRSPKLYYEADFEAVYSYPIIYDGFYILSHQPQFLSIHAPYVNIHGHTHSIKQELINKEGLNLYYNVCVECIDYTPINFKEIKQYYVGSDDKE